MVSSVVHSETEQLWLTRASKPVMTPTTPFQAGGDVFTHAKMSSLMPPRSQSARPASGTTEILETDFEDDESEFEEYSAKSSFDSVCRSTGRDFSNS